MDAFKINQHDDGLVELIFDCPDEKVNKFSEAVMEQFETHLNAFKNDTSIKGLVLKSAKKDIFIAGADIEEIREIKDKEHAKHKIERGQSIFNLLDDLPFPTMSLIHGACMGGGMECALACDYRFATDDPKTKLALPEVQLGFIPGWGGTQRMPRLIGLQLSLDLISTGRPLVGRKAYKAGLVDALFTPEGREREFSLVWSKIKAGQYKRRKRKTKWLDTLLEKTIPGRRLLFSIAKKKALSKTKGHYPAVTTILEVLENTHGVSLKEGLQVELDKFIDLATGPVSRNLVQLFFSNELIKKTPGCPTLDLPRTQPKQAAVLGAGIMGGGIAWLFSSKHIPVRLKDLNNEALQKGYQAADGYYSQLVKRRRMKPSQKTIAMQHISSDLSYKGFDKMDIVIEAIVENMDIKKKALSELEDNVSSECIIASNTSALSVDEMASSLKQPERFLGIHFFNPVNRMPLVEIIPNEKTSNETIYKVCQWIKQMGKSTIVVKNCAGFLVNRILLTYMNEAARTLEDGAGIEQVDKLMLDFGMPMGPFTLADEVGLDVGIHVARTLESAYGERMKVAKPLALVHHDLKLLGKKDKQGFYTWQSKKAEVNTKVTHALSHHQQTTLDDTAIVERCILIMVNEAALCLEEKVVSSPEEIDMAMIMGTGFPPFRGGLLKYADQYGISNCVNTLKDLSTKVGDRFQPAPLLLKMAEDKETFYKNS